MDGLGESRVSSNAEGQIVLDSATGRKVRYVAETSFNQSTGAEGSKKRRWFVCGICDELLPQKAPASQLLCKRCFTASSASPATAVARAAAPPPPLPYEGEPQYNGAAIAVCTLSTVECASPPTGEDWVNGSMFTFQGGAHDQFALLRHLEASTHHRLKTNARIFDNRALDVAGRGTHGPNQVDSEMRRLYEQLRDQRNAVVRATEQRIASLPFTSHSVQNGSTLGILVDCYSKLAQHVVDDCFDNEALDGSLLDYTRLRLDETQARGELVAEPPVSEEQRKALERTLKRVCDYDALLKDMLGLFNAPPSIMTVAAQPASGAVDPSVVIDSDSDDLGAGFCAKAIYTDFSLTARVCTYPQRATAAALQCKATRKQHAALFAALDVVAFATRILRWLRTPFQSKLVRWARSSGGRRVARADSDDSVDSDLTAVVEQLVHVVTDLMQVFREAESNQLAPFVRARAPAWWQCDGTPSLEALQRLLDEMPAVKAQVLANRLDEDALTDLVATPEFSKEEKKRFTAALVASAAPTLVPWVWKALHAHLTRLLTSSPAVRLCGMHHTAVLVIESLATREAAHVAAMLASAREQCGHGSAKYLKLDLKVLYDQVKQHTLTRGLKRKVSLVTELRGEPHSTRLDNGANCLPQVAKWDNARCSTAAVVWCLKVVSEIHAMETDQRHDPLFHLIPFLDGVPARGDPESCRAALLQQEEPLHISNLFDKSMPVYRCQVEKVARRLFDATPGIKKTKRRYEIPAAELLRILA
jgi:hypothetical protein